jgi:hypothetical protein
MIAAMAEARIKGDRKPRYNLCGDCGQVVAETELLCADCRQSILIQDTEEDTHDISEARADAYIQDIEYLRTGEYDE